MDYLGLPVLDIAPDFTSLRSGLVDDSTFASESGGIGTPWKVTDGPRRTISYPFSLTSREEIAEFRRFIAGRYGRLSVFWLPVYLLDYKLVSISGTEVIIEHIGLADAVDDFGQFGHIAFYSGGVLQIAKIDSIVSDGTEETITLTDTLDTEPDPSETLCGGAMAVRCFSDSLEYKFRGLEFAEVDVRFIELPREYPSGSGGGGGELDNPIDFDGGTPPASPSCGVGTLDTAISNYVWFIPGDQNPNDIIDDAILDVYKALFIAERTIHQEGRTVNSSGEWYWYFSNSSGSLKSAYMKTGYPSTDPESSDGDVYTYTSGGGWWALAQEYCYS